MGSWGRIGEVPRGYGSPEEDLGCPRGSGEPQHQPGVDREIWQWHLGERSRVGDQGGADGHSSETSPPISHRHPPNILGTSGWVQGLLGMFWGPHTHADEGSHGSTREPAQVTVGHVPALGMKDHGARGATGVPLLPRRLEGPQGSSPIMGVWPISIVGVQHGHGGVQPHGGGPTQLWGSDPAPSC